MCACFTLGKNSVRFFQIFQLMLGQKNLGAQHGMSYRDLCCLYLYISVLGGDIRRHLFFIT